MPIQNNASLLSRLSTSSAISGALAALLAPFSSHALPSGGAVVAGQADINAAGNSLNITQSSQRAILQWQGFNVAGGESVNFAQPNAQAIALNRVVGDANPSQILGAINANGQVWIVNPHGVMFGSSAQVNVGGLVATSSNIADNDFMGGNYVFGQPGNPNASISNAGNITVADGGIVAFAGANVSNTGLIEAKLGKVQLASGDTFTLDLYGDGLISLQASPVITQQLVSNSGTIRADGGTVMLTAAAASATINSLINMDGLIQANAVDGKSGRVLLYAEGSNAVQNNIAANKGIKDGVSTVLVAGTIETKNDSGIGGTVEVLGDHVGLLTGSTINASGTEGGGTVLIGGQYQGLGDTPTALRVVMQNGASILANAIDHGDGGDVILWADYRTDFAGSIEAKGGAISGDGGFVETSGKQVLRAFGLVNASAANGQAGLWLLDPNDITIMDDPGGGDVNVTGDPNFTTTDDSAIVTTESIEANLDAGTSVTITTSSLGNNGQSGNITLSNSIAKTGGGNATLTLQAANDIILSNGTAITSTKGTLGVVLTADNDATGGGAVYIGMVSIDSNGGAITITGKGSAAYNGGVTMDGANITANGGNIDITGTTNGNGSAGINASGTIISTTGSGTITLTGTGIFNASTNHGVILTNSTNVSSVDGAIAITGNADAGGGASSGISVDAGAIIEATGSGTITLTAVSTNTAAAISLSNTKADTIFSGGGTVTLTTAGSTFGDIYINGANITNSGGGAPDVSITGVGNVTMTDANITTNGGDINLSSAGNSSGTGIILDASQLTTKGTGTVTLTGTGATGNVGVQLQNAATISTVNGAISISGTAPGAGNYGISMTGSSKISASGSGTITLDGTSNNPGSYDGIYITSVVQSDAIVSGGGDVLLKSDGNLGISNVNIVGTSAFNLTITPNGAAGGGNLVMVGVNIDTSGGDITFSASTGTAESTPYNLTKTSIKAAGGNIAITGTGTGSGGGIYISSSQITTTGSGTISLGGYSGAGVSSTGLYLDGVGTLVSSVDGDITLLGDALASSANPNGFYMVEGQIKTTGAGGISITGLTTKADPSIRIVLGGVDAIVSGGGLIKFSTSGSTNGDIYISGANITYTGAGAPNVDITATGNVTMDNSDIATNGGGITISGNGSASSNDGINIQNSTFNAGGGNISLTGTAYSGSTGNGTFFAFGNNMLTKGTGTITITGTDGGNAGGGTGISWNSNITVGSGTVKFTSTGSMGFIGVVDSVSSSKYDVSMTASSGISTMGTLLVDSTTIKTYGGNISLSGSSALNLSSGVVLQTATKLYAAGGDISVMGSTTGGIGVSIVDTAVIQTTGNGTITLSGQGSDGGAADGTGLLLDEGSSVSAVDGYISISGTGKNSANAHGAYITGGATITSTGKGTIGVSGTSTNSANGVGVYIANGSPTDVITSAGGDVTLGSTDSVVLSNSNITSASASFNVNIHTNVLSAGGAISLSASNITTKGGSITMSGWDGVGYTGAATGTANYNTGILLTDSQLNAGGGGITMIGKGYSQTSSSGIKLAGSTKIQTIGSGSINITGTGGSSASNTNDNYGVYIANANTLSTVDGAININGTGGGDGNGTGQYGFYLNNGAILKATGSGNITITGTGANNSAGIVIDNSALFTTTDALAANGNIFLTSNTDIYLAYAKLFRHSAGTCNIMLNADADGNGGAIMLSATTLYTAGGNVTMGGGADPTTIAAIGSATYTSGITIASNSSIDAAGGNISLLGTGHSAGGQGIEHTSATTKTKGNGTITMKGTGVDGSDGVSLGGTIEAVNGNITITGVASGVVNSDGIRVAGGMVYTTGTGNITLTGFGQSGADYGIWVDMGGATFGGASDNGDITFIADTINMDTATTIQSLKIVTFKPYTNDTTIGFGGGAGGTLQVTQTLMNSINAPTVVVGVSDAGDLSAGAFAWQSTLLNLFLIGENVTIGGNSAKTSGNSANLTVQANDNITVSGAVIISSTSNELNVVFNADRDGVSGGSILMNAGSGITSNNGDVTFGGGANPATTAAKGFGASISGIELDDAAIDVGSSGNISFLGEGNTGGADSHGIYLHSGTTLSADAGNITLSGTGNFVSSGVIITDSMTTVSAGNGDITITGHGKASLGNQRYGVYIANDAVVSASGTGEINITGIGDNSGFGEIGVYIDATVSGVNGDINITGQGTNHYGISLEAGATILTTTGGTGIITFTGTSDHFGPYYGIVTTGAVTIGGADDDGNINFVADQLIFDAANLTIQTSKTVLFIPYTDGTSVGVSGGAGVLQIKQDIINAVTAQKLIIDPAGDMTISATTWGSGFDELEFEAGGTITIDGDITKDDGGNGILTFLAGKHIVVNSNSNITSVSGKMDTVLNSDTDATDGGSIIMHTGASIESNGGDITLGGGVDPTTNAASGNVDYSYGILLDATTIDAAGGNISMIGTGYGTDSDNYGIWVNDNSTIKTSGSGTIAVVGTGGGNGAGADNFGFYLVDSTITAENGAIDITGGGGGGSGGSNHGINQFDSSILSTGLSTITLTGIQGSAGSNTGFVIDGSSNVIGGGAANGNINIIADTIDFDAAALIIETTEGVYFKPFTANTTIGVGTGSGTLLITDAVLGIIKAANLAIGDANAGAMDIDTAFTFDEDVAFLTDPTKAITTQGTIAASNFDIYFASKVTLGGNTIIDTAGGDLAFAKTIDGGKNLTITTGTGSFSLGGAVGATTALGTLTITTDSIGGLSIIHNITTNNAAVTLKSIGDIILSNTTITTQGGALLLNADYQDTNGSTVGAIELSNSTVSTGGGNITMGGGTDPTTMDAIGNGANANGIFLKGSVALDAGGGNISLRGTSIINSGVGVYVYQGSKIKTSGTGNISLYGTGFNAGVSLEGNAGNMGIETTGTGTITLSGVGTVGIHTNGNANNITIGGASDNGNIIFIADTIDIDTANTAIQTKQTVTFAPYTAATTVGFAGGAGTLQVTQDIMDIVNAPNVVVGSIDSGDITTGDFTWGATLNKLNIISGAGIAITDDIAKTVGGDGTLLFYANGDIVVSANANITSTSNKLITTLNADTDEDEDGAIVMGSGSSIVTNGGNLRLGGGNNGYAFGNATYTSGISLDNVTLDAGGGTIVLAGQDGSTAGDGAIYIYGGSIIKTTGTGTIDLLGISHSAGVVGLHMKDSGTALSTVNGAITLSGTANDGGIGIHLEGGVTITSTGAGIISLTGTGGNGNGDSGSPDGGNTGGNGNTGGDGIVSAATITAIAKISLGGSGGIGATGGDGNVIGGSGGAGGRGIVNSGIITNTTGILVLTGSGGAGGVSGGGASNGGIGGTGGVGIENTGALTNGSGGISFSAAGGNGGDGAATLWNGGSGGTGAVGIISDGAIIAGTTTVTLTGSAGNGGTKGCGPNTCGSDGTSANDGITLTEDITTNNGNVSLYSSTNIASNGATIKTKGGYVLFNADMGGGGLGALSLTGTTIDSGGGNITLAGGTDPTTMAAIGNIHYVDGISLSGSTLNAGGGNVLLYGRGGGGVGDNTGIVLDGTTITTKGTGTISVSGDYHAGNNGMARGIFMQNSSAIATTGSGTITIGALGNFDTGLVVADSSFGGATDGGNITFIINSIDFTKSSIETTKTVTFSTVGIAAGKYDIGLNNAADMNITQAIMDAIIAPTVVLSSNKNALIGAFTWQSTLTQLTITAEDDISIVGDVEKSAGGDATLTVEADGNTTMDSNVDITSTSNKLNVTLGGSQVIFSGTNTITTNDGNIAVDAAVELGGHQAWDAGAGTISFASTIDGKYNLTLVAKTLTFGGALGGNTALDTVDFTAGSALTLPAITADGSITVVSKATFDIILNGILTSDAAGDAIIVASGDDFINNVGAGVLTLTGGGRWIGYSTKAADDTGTLASDQVIKSKTYANLPPGSIVPATYSDTDNTWVYSTGVASGNITITAKAQSMTYGAATPALTYNFSCDTSCTEVDAGISGALAIDFAGGDLSTSGNLIVGIYDILIGTLTAANPGFTISVYNPDSLTVNQKAITITGVTADNKIYDATNTATLNTGGAALSGVVNGLANGGGGPLDTVNLSVAGATGTFANVNVGNGKTVTGAGFTISGADSGNYTLTQPTTTANITKAGLTLTAKNVSMTYADGTGLVGTNFSAAGLQGSDTVGSVTLTTDATKSSSSNWKVGNWTLSASAATGGTFDAGNYTISYVDGTHVVGLRTITVTGVTANDKDYDGTTTATLNVGGAGLSGIVNGLNNGGGGPVDTVTLGTGGTSGSFANANVGNGKTVTTAGFTLGGADGGNYTIAQPTTTANINKAALTITAKDVGATYGDGTTLTGTKFTSAGLAGGETIGSVTITTDATKSASNHYNAGVWDITPSAATGGTFNAANYSISYVDGTLTVGQATLTVTADAKSKTYGAADPTLTYQSSGFVTGDTAALFTGALARAAGETVAGGPYAINQGTLSAGGNYSFNFNTDDLTITKASLSVTASAQTKTYGFGGTSAALGTTAFTTSGLQNGETIGGVTLSTNAGTSTSSNYKAGSWNITPSVATGGTFDAANYTITYNAAVGGLTVNQATLTVSGATGDNKVYDGTTTATVNIGGVTLNGAIGGDDVLLDASGVTGNFADKNVGNGKSITASGFTLTNADAANYSLTQPSGFTANITSAPITVTANNMSRSYGSANPVFTYSYNGLVGGDTSTTFSGALASAANAASNVGGYAITIGSLAGSGNYAITVFNGATLTVNQATLTIVADNKSKIRGTDNPELTYQYNGFANGQSEAILTGLASINTVAAKNSAVGAYAISITLGTLADPTGNYTFAFTDGTLTILADTPVIGADQAGQMNSIIIQDRRTTGIELGHNPNPDPIFSFISPPMGDESPSAGFPGAQLSLHPFSNMPHLDCSVVAPDGSTYCTY